MSRVRYRQASLVFAVLVVTRHGAAVPAVSVRANGSCPTDRELKAALVERGLEVGGANYTVDVQSETTGATLRLQHGAQGQVLERHFASQDCRALAEAIAVVVEAYFIEVRAPDIESTNGSAGNNSSQAGTALAPNPSMQNDLGPNSTPPPPRAPPSQLDTMARRQPPTAPPSQLDTTARHERLPAPGAPGSAPKLRQPLSFEGFVGVGPALTLPNAEFTPEVEVGAGTDVHSVPISTELALATTWPTISGSGLDRVRRWGNQGVLRVGVPLVGALRYQPWLGLGLAVARLHALDVPAAPTKTTMTSMVEAGLEIAWPLGAAWHGRFDVGCSVLMLRDTYLVDPDGEIGRGPRVVCATLIGIGIGSASVGQELHR